MRLPCDRSLGDLAAVERGESCGSYIEHREQKSGKESVRLTAVFNVAENLVSKNGSGER